ncbi:MAG TPA: hypothetical protein GXX19_09085 [Syntrophomonadaceae bacterium]|nr:hypothetical protein [Syntrophomonadaceae bacterium]
MGAYKIMMSTSFNKLRKKWYYFDQKDRRVAKKNGKRSNWPYDLTLADTINSDSNSIWIKLTDEERDDIIDYKALAV